MGFGISFLGDDDEQNGSPEQKHQQAIKLLSVRFPRVVGAAGLAPTPLLQGMGGSGNPMGQTAVAQALAHMAGMPQPGHPPMSGAPLPQPPMGGPPRTPMPIPRVIPGLDALPGPVPAGPVTREWMPPPVQEQPFVPEMPENPLSVLQEMLARKRGPGPGFQEPI